MKKPVLFIDMDGTLVEWNTELPEFANEIFKPGYFKERPAYPMMPEAIRDIIHCSAFEVYTLSSVIDGPYAVLDKNVWLDENIPELDEKHRIFCRCGENKAKKVESLFGDFGENFILLDDYTVNLRQWESSGGTAIKLLNGINGTNGTWKGVEVSRFASNPTELKDKLLTAIIISLTRKKEC